MVSQADRPGGNRLDICGAGENNGSHRDRDGNHGAFWTVLKLRRWSPSRDPDGPVGGKLKTDNQYSEWSICQGAGRAVRNDTQLRFIFDELIRKWEANGGRQQDKFLLAAVSNPLARR